jgi:hypothetical protein
MKELSLLFVVVGVTFFIIGLLCGLIGQSVLNPYTYSSFRGYEIRTNKNTGVREYSTPQGWEVAH